MTSRERRTWMWAEACALLDQAERMHRQFFQLSPAVRLAWEPPVDIYETERDLSILVALPGVEPGRVATRIEAGTVIVAGERPLPAEFRKASIYRLEIPHGHFERRIELPPGRYEVERQELSHGCLLLKLRKLR